MNLHTYYYGTQDAAFEDFEDFRYQGDFVEQRVYTLGPGETQLVIEQVEGHGITNFQISGPFEKVRLLLSWSYIDSMYSFTDKFLLKTHIIPSCLKGMHLAVDHTEPVEIRLDYVKLTNYNESDVRELFFHQTQNITFPVKKGHNKVRINCFNHPVTKLKLFGDCSMSDAFLRLFPRIGRTLEFDETGECDLEPSSINFSMVPDAYMYIDSDRNCDEVHLVAECKQIVHISQGFFGLKFSK